jgi:hypothetical protein
LQHAYLRGFVDQIVEQGLPACNCPNVDKSGDINEAYPTKDPMWQFVSPIPKSEESFGERAILREESPPPP